MSMKLTRTSLAEQGYLALAGKIVSGEWAGGTRLTEEAVSQLLGISRTPVREALRRLAAEGLIEVQARCGYRVAAFDVESVRELFDCRARLEVMALECALPHLPEAELLALRAQLAAAPPDELGRISLEVDVAIHELIAAHCNNRYLRRFCRIWFVAGGRFAPTAALRNRCGSGWGRLVDLLTRDYAAASARLGAHIRNGGLAVVRRPAG